MGTITEDRKATIYASRASRRTMNSDRDQDGRKNLSDGQDPGSGADAFGRAAWALVVFSF